MRNRSIECCVCIDKRSCWDIVVEAYASVSGLVRGPNFRKFGIRANQITSAMMVMLDGIFLPVHPTIMMVMREFIRY